jgi:molybdenum cofactor synthesis domain-containing protein
MSDDNATIVSAAILVIGDEILSGRTKDKNIGYIAEYLTTIGIDVREVRVVPDVEDEIVTALNALRSRYSYVFTTGGIGPTHDDITAACVAKAHPDVTIGSYPFFDDKAGPNTNIVVRARDGEKLIAAKAAVEAMLVQVRSRFAST